MRHTKLGNVGLLAFSTLVALSASELIVRIIYPEPAYALRAPFLAATFTPNSSVMPGVSGEAHFVLNADGFRSASPTSQQTYRVLAIGASTTECLYLDQPETWTELLKDRLNAARSRDLAWVGNAGVSGHSMRHHVTALEELPLANLGLDAVLLLPGVNDFAHRLAVDGPFDADFMTRPDSRHRLINQTFGYGPKWEEGDAFYKRSALYRLISSARQGRGQTSVRLQDPTGSVYTAWRRYRSETKELRDVLPDLESSLAEYASNLRRFINSARAKGLHVIMMTQPSMWRPDLPERLQQLLWMGGVGDYQSGRGVAYYTPAALSSGLERYNDTLRDVCRAADVECIDLAPRIDKDDSSFYDDVHFNEQGARKVASVIAEYLTRRPPFRQ